MIEDVVKLAWNLDYSTEQRVLANGVAVVIGTICEYGSASTAGQEILLTTPANANAIAIEAGTGDGTKTFRFLVRGPVVVDNGKLAYNSQTAATTNTALAALGIVAKGGLTWLAANE